MKPKREHPFVTLHRQLGMSNAALARRVGCTPQWISNMLMRARRNPEYLMPVIWAMRLSSFFGVDVKLFRPDLPWELVR